MLTFRPSVAILAALLSALPLVASAQAATDDEAPPFASAQPPCNCPCPDRRIFGSTRALEPGTTDVAAGFEMGFEPRFGYADGPVAAARSSLVDLTVVHRFASSRSAIRVALDPIGAVNEGGPRVPIVRASALAGLNKETLRFLVGISGFSITDEDYTGTRRSTRGMQGLARLELGRPLQTHLIVEGGTGLARTWDLDVGTRQERVPGFSGAMRVQFGFPTRHREFGAIRLSTRWFGASAWMIGEAGLDLVVARSLGGGRPAIVLGYRWTAIWNDAGASAHGFRVGAEWYGLGRLPPPPRP